MSRSPGSTASLSATKQRSAVDNLATQKWDFVALQTFGIGTLNDPIKKVIDSGTPVIAMDTMMAPEGQLALHTFIAPDNIMMGSVVTNQIMKAIGGKGNVVMTQGALGHTGAQGRAKGFKQVVANYPGREGGRRTAGRLGRDQGRAHLGVAADQISRTSPAPSSTMTTWRWPRTTS